VRKLPYLFFFLSGASSLVLEVAWVRQFSLVLGNTVLSATAVLTAFMGGLALGSFLAGRAAARVRRPLRAYGLLEGGVGAYAVVLPFLIRAGEPLLRGVYDGLIDRPAALTALRLAIALVLLLVPTTMMGATLPLLSQALIRRREEAGPVSGRLYAANLLGAGCGSFLGGFVLLPGIGLTLTVVLAAAVNLGIAGTAWSAFRNATILQGDSGARRSGKSGKRKKSPAPAAAPPEPSPMSPEPLAGTARVAVLLFALSGAASMIYQVTWVRLLSLVFGSSVYSFGLTVTVFIVGLGVGDWVFSSPRIRARNGLAVLAAILAASGLASLASLPLVQQLPEKTFLVVRGGSSYGGLLRFQVGWTFGVLFLPTFFMGSVFPVVIRVLSRSRGAAGSIVGLAYSWNTVGAIVGTLAGGLVLVPVLGIQRALVAGVSLSLAAAALGVLFSHGKTPLRLAFAGAAVAGAVAAWLVPPPLDAMVLSSGPYHPATASLAGDRAGYRDFTRGKNYRLVFHEEGMAATVSVREDAAGDLALVIGGKVDASISEDGGDLPTQIMLSTLPLLLHGDAQDLLVIGLASGMSVGSAEAFPLASIDCVEISPEVVRACREHFDAHNGHALEDPRVRIILTDARHHVTMTRKTYDVIVSEPSNPWIAGINALFTRDFFETARGRLKPGGLFCQWFHAYAMSPAGVEVILRTFTGVFPHVTLWESLSGDYFLIGSDSPYALHPDSWDERVAADPGIAGWLRRAGVDDPRGGILGSLMSDGAFLRGVIGDGAVNTDDNGFLEYRAPYDMYSQASFPAEFFASLRTSDLASLVPDAKPSLQETMSNAARARMEEYRARRAAETQLFDASERSFETAFRLNPHDPLIRTERAQLLMAKSNALIRGGDPQSALVALDGIVAGPPLQAEAYYLGWAHTARGTAYNMLDEPEQALEALDLAKEYTPGNGRMWVLRAMVLQRLERLEDALEALASAEEHGVRDIEVYLTRAAIHADAGNLAEAREAVRTAEALYPGDPRIAAVRSRIGS